MMKEPAGDEEKTIRQYETAQARHDTDYNPTSLTQKKPQSLKNQTLRYPLPATLSPLHLLGDCLGLCKQEQIVASSGLGIRPRHVETPKGMPAYQSSGALAVQV